MAILPRYQRTGITTRQPGNIDFADVREQAKLSQTLSQQLDRMSDFAFKKSAEMAVERGQERVREEGAIPTLQSIEQKGGPRGIAERAAVDAANRIAVVEIETLATQDMQTLTLEADKTNMSMPVYQEKMRDINDGYRASLEVVDPVAAGVLGARLQGSSSSYENRYSEVVFKKAKIAWAKTVNTTVTTNAQLMLDSATQPGATEESINAAGKKLYETQITLGVGGEKARKVVDDILKAAIRENRVYLFKEAAGINEKKALIKQYGEKPLPNTSYETNLNFVNSLQGKLNTEINKARGEFTNDFNATLKIIAKTAKVPEGFNISVIDDLYSEEEAASIQYSFDKAILSSERLGAISSMTPDSVEQMTNSLISEYEMTKDPQKKLLLSGVIQDFEAGLASRDADIREDAGLYVAKLDDSFGNIINDVQGHLDNRNLEAAARSLTNWNTIATQQFDLIGVPEDQRNVLPKALASQIVETIKSYGADLSANNLEAIKQNLGDFAPKFINELQKQNLPPEIVTAMYIDNRPEVQTELVALADQNIEDLYKTQRSGLKTELNNALKDALLATGYGEAFTAGGGGAANDIYLTQQIMLEKLMVSRTNGKNVEVNGLREYAIKAIKDVIPWANQSVNLEPLGNFVVPMDFDMETIKTDLYNIKTVEAFRQLGVKPLDIPGLKEYADLEISLGSLEDYGVFLNTSDGRGVQLHYDINDTRYPSGLIIEFSKLPSLVSGLSLASAQQDIGVSGQVAAPYIAPTAQEKGAYAAPQGTWGRVLVDEVESETEGSN